MKTEVVIEMACGAPERHALECTAEATLVGAYRERRWGMYAAMRAGVRDRVCCGPLPPAGGVCGFEGPVDVELIDGEPGRGSWTCPRCQAQHVEVSTSG
jgi:hypothetical protein